MITNILELLVFRQKSATHASSEGKLYSRARWRISIPGGWFPTPSPGHTNALLSIHNHNMCDIVIANVSIESAIDIAGDSGHDGSFGGKVANGEVCPVVEELVWGAPGALGVLGAWVALAGDAGGEVWLTRKRRL